MYKTKLENFFFKDITLETINKLFSLYGAEHMARISPLIITPGLF